MGPGVESLPFIISRRNRVLGLVTSYPVNGFKSSPGMISWITLDGPQDSGSAIATTPFSPMLTPRFPRDLVLI